jgi:hypothetical protein
MEKEKIRAVLINQKSDLIDYVSVAVNQRSVAIDHTSIAIN